MKNVQILTDDCEALLHISGKVFEAVDIVEAFLEEVYEVGDQIKAELKDQHE
jgi:hypothetical protein